MKSISTFQGYKPYSPFKNHSSAKQKTNQKRCWSGEVTLLEDKKKFVGSGLRYKCLILYFFKCHVLLLEEIEFKSHKF